MKIIQVAFQELICRNFSPDLRNLIYLITSKFKIMRNLLLLLGMSLWLISCINPKPETKDSIQTPESEVSVPLTQTVSINVVGMTCGGCENAINKSIRKLSGITDVTSSHKDGITKVVIDNKKVNTDELCKAISDAGYMVSDFHLINTNTNK